MTWRRFLAAIVVTSHDALLTPRLPAPLFSTEVTEADMEGEFFREE